MPERYQTDEAIILVKAAPQASSKYGETVCCAGVTLDGKWVRLYPVTFRSLDMASKFGRWDRIRYRWCPPNDDTRPESRRVDQTSIEIIKKIEVKERAKFFDPLICESLKAERQKGKSLALIRPIAPEFSYIRKSPEQIEDEKEKFRQLTLQKDMFIKPLVPYTPAPYEFKYTYQTIDGTHTGTCQDWEIDATFLKWSNHFGDEQKALAEMETVFGVNYPRDGMCLAMGTHSRFPDTWLINGVIRLDEIKQLTLFS